MNIRHYVIILLLLAILFLYNKQENLDTIPSLSNEAIQNIASVYNNQNMKVTNLKVTNNINTDGTINASGAINASSLTLNNKKIRIFDMGGYKDKTNNITNYIWVNPNNGAVGIPIVDPSGITYSSTDWICLVVGLYMPKDGNTSTSGSFFARASIKDGKWVIQFFEGGNDSDYLRSRSIITILAIPIEFVDTAFSKINITVGY
jgi:hypothetical protein